MLPVVPLTPALFSMAVLELALASGDGYQDCVLELCERHGIDVMDVPVLLTDQLRSLIEAEAVFKNQLRKGVDKTK